MHFTLRDGDFKYIDYNSVERVLTNGEREREKCFI